MGVLFALATAAGWAGYNIAVRRGLESMPSAAGYLVTLLTGVVFNGLFLLLPLPGRGEGAAPGAGGWVVLGVPALAVLWFTLAGFSTTLLGRWAYFKSVDLLGPSRASAWKNTSPLTTLAVAAVWLGESISLKAVGGTTLALTGLLLLSREQGRTLSSRLTGGQLRAGTLLGLACSLGFAGGMVFRKAGLTLWPDVAAGTAIGGLAALLVYLPFAVVKGEVRELFRRPGPGVRMFFLAGLLSSLAQLGTFLSLREIPTATTHVIVSLEPLVTMVLSALFLKRQEGLTASLIGSACLLCLGAAIIVNR